MASIEPGREKRLRRLMPAPDVHVRRHVRRTSTLPRRRPGSRSRWYLAGYEEGRFAAEVNLETRDSRAELEQALEDGTLGEIAGQVREHQVQMAGDLSYDVGYPGGPTEAQYEKWESGFYEGFEATVRLYAEKRAGE